LTFSASREGPLDLLFLIAGAFALLRAVRRRVSLTVLAATNHRRDLSVSTVVAIDPPEDEPTASSGGAV
jgi:hypothetical protein